MRVGFAQMKVQLAPRDPGQVEKVVDKARLQFDVSADHLKSFARFLVKVTDRSTIPPAQIRIGVRGVRNSWLRVARKRSLAALADSAASFCCFSSASILRR